MDEDGYRTLLETLGAPAQTVDVASADQRLHVADGGEWSPHWRSGIEVGELIGEGGSGWVHEAIQHSLRRSVAVKTTRDSSSDERREAMLREARVMGALEHPNIVPVHEVITGANGEPFVLMKRVEGVSLLSVIHEPASRPGGRHPEGPIVHAVEVMVDVCRAVHFAHTRGVLHRDIKPANIMLGSFGEVYLMDWGIACASPEGQGRSAAPPPRKGVAGTPAYMAPEQALGDPADLGPWTDIYLLGATLHHAVTGSPPHAGRRMFDALWSAISEEKHDYDDVPDELSVVLRRAMKLNREDRFESVSAMQAALEAFLRHRNSYLLTQRAESSLLAARAMSTSDAEAASRLIAARTGFDQALALWSGNTRARELLFESTAALARRELARENLPAAQSLLDDLRGGPPELRAQAESLRRLIAERTAEVASLRSYGRENDLGRGASRRILALVVFMVLTVGSHVLRFAVGRPPTEWSPLSFVAGGASSVALTLVILFLFRDTFRANRANRSFAIAFAGATPIILCLRIVAAVSGWSFPSVMAAEYFIYAYGLVGVAMAVGWRVLVSAVVCLIAGIAGALLPRYVQLTSAAGLTVAIGLIAWGWRKVRPDETSMP